MAGPPPLPHASAPPATRRLSKPMLAWWAVLPAAVFVVAQLVYGWEDAKKRASGPDYAVSYLLGGLIGGLLFSGLIGWFAYRVVRRSQTAATVVFTFMLVVFTLSVYLRSQRPSGS